MGEIHELFVLPLSLVWFAGATPDFGPLGIRANRANRFVRITPLSVERLWEIARLHGMHELPQLRLSSSSRKGKKVQGATGLRASERTSASERVSERTSENLSKISQKTLKTSKDL